MSTDGGHPGGGGEDEQGKGSADSDAKREHDANKASKPPKVDRALLEFLVCPERKTTLIYDAEHQELISPTADLAYPIRDGVPLLTADCARPLTDHDRRRHRIKV